MLIFHNGISFFPPRLCRHQNTEGLSWANYTAHLWQVAARFKTVSLKQASVVFGPGVVLVILSLSVSFGAILGR